MNNRREDLLKRRYTLDGLVALFGISSWLCINSTFLQLPLLVETAPEKWSLPSYIVIVIQLANIGPLLYTGAQMWRPIRDSHFITGLLVIGIISSISFGFFYNKTIHLLGSDRSVPLLVIVFGLALVGCTSSVLFMPYMGRFQEIYLITYLIGEGLSGFVPSIVTLIQGVGGNTECIVKQEGNETIYEHYTPPPRFSVETFFIFVASLFLFCSIAFLLIDNLPTFKKQYSNVVIRSGNDYRYRKENDDVSDMNIHTEEKLSNFSYIYLMILMALVCAFTNGLFPSIQTYSCLPYGNVAYHWVVVLTSIANPLACFLAFFLPHKSMKQVNYLSIIVLLLATYVITTAVTSPPPMVRSGLGQVLVIICWTALTSFHSYVRLSINSIFRTQGGKSLVWIGSCQQVGSFIGSIASFTLIHFTNIFKYYDVCQEYKH